MGKQKQPVRAWAVIFWLLVWQAAAMVLAAAYPHGALLLASPLAVAVRLGQLWGTAAYWQTVCRSAARIFGGFLISTALGVLLASLAANAAVLTDNALSINGNRVNGAEKTVKSWASSVIG